MFILVLPTMTGYHKFEIEWNTCTVGRHLAAFKPSELGKPPAHICEIAIRGAESFLVSSAEEIEGSIIDTE